MNRVAETGQFRDKVSELIDQFSSPIQEQTFAGAEPGPPLEHVTRKHFIDPFLRALGWDLSKLNEQMIEEARTRGETTLRLDYLGVNQETRAPLLIVEAKSWTAPFVAASSFEGRAEGIEHSLSNSLICAAIEHCKTGGAPEDSPVTVEWTKYLAKLCQYVAAVKAESDHVVSRVATLSGQWLVIFDDPDAVFLAAGTVNPLLIHIYRERDLVTKAEEIFSLLAKSSISPTVPSMLRPTLVTAYARASDVRRAYRALWVTYRATGPSFRARPTVELDAAVVLERGDKALLVVVDKSLQWQEIPHDPSNLDAHIDAVGAQADVLLGRIGAELGANLQPSGVETFPGFPRSRIAGAPNDIQPGMQPRIDLIRIAIGAGEFLLVTGTAKHFLQKKPTVHPCDWHDWARCKTHSHEHGANPVFGPSVEPKTLFYSAQGHHCAHQVVHDRRITRCQIQAFEEFLCCRACALQTFCWQQGELDALPCGKGGTAVGHE